MANDEKKPVSLNKQSLAKMLAAETGLAGIVAQETVETLCDIITRTVAEGGSVSITNFISLKRVGKKSRMARNPHTGDRIEIPSRFAVRASISPRFNDFANSDNPSRATIRKSGKGPARKPTELRQEGDAVDIRNKDYVNMNDGIPGESALREGSVIRARGGVRRGL